MGQASARFGNLDSQVIAVLKAALYIFNIFWIYTWNSYILSSAALLSTNFVHKRLDRIFIQSSATKSIPFILSLDRLFKYSLSTRSSQLYLVKKSSTLFKSSDDPLVEVEEGWEGSLSPAACLRFLYLLMILRKFSPIYYNIEWDDLKGHFFFLLTVWCANENHTFTNLCRLHLCPFFRIFERPLNFLVFSFNELI